MLKTGRPLRNRRRWRWARLLPGVFTQNMRGSGPGSILGQKVGGTPALNTAANPASAGDYLWIYCTGLGTVSPGIAAGAAATYPPLYNTDNTVTVTVGGIDASLRSPDWPQGMWGCTR